MSGQLWLPFNGMVEHGAEEGGELGVALAGTGKRVDGSIRVGVRAAGVGKLCLKPAAVVGKEGLCLDKGVIVGNGIDLPVEALPVGQAIGLSGLEDLRGAMAGFTPAVMMSELIAGGRVALEIAGMADRVCFLTALMDNAAVGVAVGLTAVDNAVAGESSVNLTDGVLEDNTCHVATLWLRLGYSVIILITYKSHKNNIRIS